MTHRKTLREFDFITSLQTLNMSWIVGTVADYLRSVKQLSKMASWLIFFFLGALCPGSAGVLACSSI
jgi:hypothetical protein